MGKSDNTLVQYLARLRDRETGTLLTFAAAWEVMLWPMTIVMALSGKTMLFMPFLYFHFIKTRYQSRRNPYCRLAFILRLRLLVQYPQSPVVSTPSFLVGTRY